MLRQNNMRIFVKKRHIPAQSCCYLVAMKFVLLFMILGFGGFGVSAFAQQQLSSAPGKKVILRGLDKVTANTVDFEITIGQSYSFGSLTIEPSYCRKRPPEEIPEVYAFLTITDRATDGSGQEVEGLNIFNGWMFASTPALNPLEHPVYDVWVLDCK
ncbi:MAG: DUF2155 domain-containing protein [Robiginitomaculum sp.]|nr:DUF2155 domain-containing protein [Robiginitomaculum sp.]